MEEPSWEAGLKQVIFFPMYNFKHIFPLLNNWTAPL